MARVNLPRNKAAAIKLARAILAKHLADGAASPLAGLNITDFTAKTNTADTQNTLAEKLRRDAETASQSCENALGRDFSTPATVSFYLAAARDVLAGLNKGSEQKLGDWGFEVDQSPLPAKPAPKKTPPTS